MARQRTIVEYFSEHERYRCGYCGSSDTNYSHGMWAHSMTVQDYQDLIDRGWRRSGKYCYKPTLNVTCCPMYTIRCQALDFKPTKSHKKVIKRVNRYLISGQKPGQGDKAGDSDQPAPECGGGGPGGDLSAPYRSSQLSLSVNSLQSGEAGKVSASADAAQNKKVKVDASSEGLKETKEDIPSSGAAKTSPTKGEGPDRDKPPCRKAKQLRLERKMQKTGLSIQDLKTKSQAKSPEEKRLEDYLNEPLQAKDPAHRLELRLVRSSPQSPDFKDSNAEAHRVYHKYQTSVHKDPPSKPNMKQYTRFLVDSPLQSVLVKPGESGVPDGYGSFHQHYLLDGKLIAVGVIDILPHCVSSVYLYYDPDYSFLSLGTYSALRELAFVRELQKSDPALQYYYMGFYIHSCPKMRYKGNYWPSFLVCPEAYSWVPIERCRPKLDISRYARFEESGKEDPEGSVEVDEVLVLHEGEAMPYEVYRLVKTNVRDQEEVKEYASFVGRTCAKRMLLYRK